MNADTLSIPGTFSRQSTLVVETALLHRFHERYGQALLNRKLTSLRREPTEAEKAQMEGIVGKLNAIRIELCR